MGPAGLGPAGVPRFVLAPKPGAVLAILSGTLAVTESGDSLAATATILVSGTLTANQANQTLAATGGPVVGGTLTANQANQTLVAAGGPTVAGNLAATEQVDTLGAAGSVTVAGALGLTEALDTLAAVGSVAVAGALGLTQANQTLSATGTSGAVSPPVRDNDCLLEFETETHDLILEDNTGFLALEVCVEAPPLQPGGEGVPLTFSRKRWRELQMLIAAEMAAVAKAERVSKPARREALLHAARAAAAAVDAAEAEGENRRLDALLVRNARILREAIRTNEAKAFNDAVRLSHQIVARRSEEDDEMISLLLLMD